jgi:hypothetical protein
VKNRNYEVPSYVIFSMFLLIAMKPSRTISSINVELKTEVSEEEDIAETLGFTQH